MTFFHPRIFMFSGVTNTIGSISQSKQKLNTSNKNLNLHKNAINTKYSLTTKLKTQMAHFSHTKSSVSIDLFNLPPLPDARRQSTMQCKIPSNLFLPDGQNNQLSKIVNTWTFDRLTPNGNEGVGVQMDYLECAYETRYYVIDKVNCQINAIHNDSLELTEFKGWFSPFDLDELERKVCRLVDKYEGTNMKMTCQSPRTHSEDMIPIQTPDHTIWKNWQVWVLMKIITAPYHQLETQLHNKEQHDQHQHLNHW